MNKLLRSLIFSILLLFCVNSAYGQFQIVSVSTEPVICNGESNGTITIEISGGIPPYEYYYGGFGGNGLHITSNTSHTFTGVKANQFYQIQVQDATLDVVSQFPVAVNQPAPLVTSIQPDPASICQNTPRQLYGNPDGGNGGYIHEWTPSDVFAGPSDVADPVFLSNDIGIHNLVYKLVDQKGCEVSQSFQVEVFATITATVSHTDVSCFQGSNGSIIISGESGGSGSYEYSVTGMPWQSGNVFNGLPAGNYEVSVRDGIHPDDCVAPLDPVVILQPASAVGGSTVSKINVLCFGESTGSLTAQGTGGVAPYQYSLNGVDFQVSGTFENLAAGDYTVTVRDANNCTFAYNDQIIQPPSAPGGSITSQTSVSCFNGNDGSVTVAGTGGTPSYQYSIDGLTFQVSGTFENLASGNYTVTVSDANGCTFDIPVIITQPAAALGGSITSQTNVSCFNGNDGSVTVAGNDGTAPYQYSIDGITFQGSGTFENLTSGSYTVTVRDSNGCTFPVAVTITQPAAALGGSIDSQSDVSCFGGNDGSVTIAGSNGTSPYQYSLNGGAFQVSGTFENLTSGNYTVTVRDSNGCTFPVAVTITQPLVALGGSIVSQANVSCFNGNDGSVTVAGNDGTSPYQYSIDGVTFQVSGTFENLTSGNYTVTVRDSNGCTFPVAVTITQPAAALGGGITSQTNVSCFGGNDGSVTVAGSNGTAPYQYSTDGVTFQDSGTFENLTSGSYTVTVRDANGCTFPVAVTITQPAAALGGSIASQTNVSCFGGNNGSVTVAGSNGTAPYQYSIDGMNFQGSGTFDNLAAGNYNITVRDAPGCTSNVSVNITQPATAVTLTINTVNDVSCFGGNDGQIQASSSGGVNPRRYQINGGALQGSGNFTGLIAGNYTVTVVDNNGCSVDADVTVSEPAALVGSVVSQTNVSCYNGSDGSVTVAGNEGTTPYQYSIDGVNFQVSGTFENLLPGDHTITIRDDNGCTTTVPVTITQPVAALSATASSTNITGCYGWTNGTISITDQLGSWAEITGNYEYTIDGWATSSLDPHFTSLPAGTYNVQIRDADNPACVFVINSALVLTQPAPITADIDAVHPVCFGGTGSISFVNVVGGTGFYQYSVTGFSTAGQSGGTFINLPAGTYDLRVRSISNPACETTINPAFQLTQPDELAASVIKTDVTVCNGNNNGEIEITGATGGSGVYHYSVNNGASWSASNSFTGLVAGNYQVMMRDAAATSCQMHLGSFDILEPDVLFAETLATGASCFNGTDGSIEFFNFAGGSGSYEFSIDGVSWQAGLIFANLAAGNYTALIRDMNHPSCEIDLGLLIVSEPEVISLNIETVVNNECFGDSGGSITASASGGTPGYVYTLFDGFNLIETQEPVYPAHAVFGGLTAGADYRISVTDSRGCDPAEIANITISEPAELDITAVVQGHIVCFGGTTGSIAITATGGTGTIWYSVNGVDFFENGGSFANLSASLYDVAVRDDNGCRTDYGQVELTQPERLSADISAVDVTCFGAGNGIIEITNPLGGTGSYEYSVNGVDWFLNPLFENLTPDTYHAFIRDAGVTSCFVELDQSPVVIDEPALLEMTVLTVDVDCNGNATGSIEIMATGGNGNYQYRLDGGVWQVENIFHNITAGNYLVEVTDQLGCMVNENAEITEPEVFTDDNILTNDESCFGANDGDIEIIVKGGTPPFRYSIDNGVTFQDDSFFGSLAPGFYDIVAFDNAGCSFYFLILIEAAVETTIDQFDVSAVSCNGAADGSVVAVASGDGPVMYSLDGIIWQASGSFSGLDRGDYTMMFRDKNGCIITQDFTIVEPDVLFAETHVTDATCFNGANGSIEFFNVSGGSGSYEFSIDGVAWQTGLTFANLAAGNYTARIRDMNHPSCEIDLGLLVVSEPEVISINIETVVNNDCFGDSGGSITASASGGTHGYIYTLFDGLVLIGTQEPAYPAHAVFGGLAAGTDYRITVTDSRGCDPAEIDHITIAEPAELEITGVVPGHIVCFGGATGSIAITATGGTGTIWYSVNGVDFYDNGGSFSNLSAGFYEVAVRDDNGCQTDYGQVELTQLDRLSADITASDITCFGAGNGIIEITNPLGGTGSYEYSVNGVDWFVNPLFENLTPHTYEVFIRDAGVVSCFVELDQSPVVIDEPALIEMTVVPSNVDCNGNATGSIEIMATGGNGNYQYRLDGGVWQAENIFHGLIPGNYLAEVTDQLGCTINESVEITEPAELIITSVTHENLLCAGAGNGTITITASGGTGTIYYSLNNGADYLENGGLFTGLDAGIYNVVVRDINGCETVYASPVELTQPAEITLTNTDIQDAGCFGSVDGSIDVTASGGTGLLEYSLDGIVYQPGGLFSGLSAGEYAIYVRDEISCVAIFSLTVNEPAELALTANVLNTSCNDAGEPQIRAQAQGGVAPYVITLYLGGVEQNSFSGIGENEWVLFESLADDMTDYMVTVADVSACGTVSSSLLSTERPAELLIGTVSSEDALCYGVSEGYIEINADGGSAPFTYILYSSDNTELDQITSSDNARFSDLVPGSYYVTITDVNGCGPVTSDEIIIEQPAELAAESLFIEHVTCNGGNSGVISVVSQGGTGAVMYSIDGGINFYPDGNFSEITAGNYELVLRDDAGCQVSIQAIEIQEPSLMEIVLIEKTDFYIGSVNETGSIRVAQVTGGVEPYSYSIDNGLSWQVDGYFDNLAEGTYEILVRDANLCTDSGSADIVALTGISAEYISVPPSCFGFDDGLISISGLDGTEPYEYSLNDGDDFFTSGNFSGLTSGVYPAVVRDGAGLIYSFEIVLEDPQLLGASASVTNTWCRDFSPYGPDGMISLNVTGGTGSYSFEWSNGSDTRDVGGLAAGTYSVTVTDQNLCEISMDVDVGFEHSINISLISEQSICPGTGATLEPVVTISGMAASYSWSALNGADPDPVLSPQVFPEVSDVYTLRVTDENSCYNEAVTGVNLHPSELLYIGNDTVIFQGTSLELEAKGGEFISYEWTGPGLSSYSGPVTTATPENETLYQVYAETENGCIEEASILIGIVQPISPVSGFTPNDDGVNDFFEIPNAQDYPEIVVEIYTRSGQRVFHSNGYTDDKRWDGTFNGKDLPMGTYYFVITLNDIFGTKPVTGPVTIVR